MTKTAKHCDGCADRVPSRFRVLLNLFLCDHCFGLWQRTGEVPSPAPRLEDQRW